MKKVLTLLALVITTFASAQTKQERNVGAFSGISGATGIQVEITQGTAETVTVVSSNDALTDNIKTVVENGVLKIYYQSKDLKSKMANKLNLKAFVTYKSINLLNVSSGASIKTMNTANVPALKIEVNSGAQLTAAIVVSELSINQNSGATSKFSGSAKNTVVDISSGAVINALDLVTEMCNVKASSGAVIKMEVTKSLDAKATSGAQVSYKGTPVINSKKVNSGGVVKSI